MRPLASLIHAFEHDGELLPPANWRQGRTIYGGLTAALALEAVRRRHGGELAPLKSAQIAFVGPAQGALRFASRVLRQGKSASWVEADCHADGQLCMRATFLFAAPRESELVHATDDRPLAGPPGAYAPIDARGQAPASLENFDLRPVGRNLPFSGAETPELTAWVRHADAGEVDPAVALVALADSLPPAACARLTRPAPFSSITWSFDLPQPAQPGTWFLLRSASQQAQGGYGYQAMQAWSEGGQLVLSGTQTVGIYS